MTAHKTQLERVRGKLHRDGFITRNECLSQFPAITRLGARIVDLEKEGYAFEAKHDHRDYRYTLLSIKGVPFQTDRKRVQLMRDNAEAVRFFDNYQPSNTSV
jgi:hypothetical protein